MKVKKLKKKLKEEWIGELERQIKDQAKQIATFQFETLFNEENNSLIKLFPPSSFSFQSSFISLDPKLVSSDSK